MGKLIQEAYAALDAAIAKDGEDELMFKICDLTAQGESIESVGRAVAVRAPVLRKWIKGEKWRLDDYEDAKKDFASRLIYEGLESARDATPEDVAVRRLQVDAYHKTAGKMSRDEWGDKQQVEVSMNGLVSLKELMRLRDERVQALTDGRNVIDLPVVVVEESRVVEI